MVGDQATFPTEAVWIGSTHPFDLHEVYLCFRGTWQLDVVPKRAILFITADSRYKLWVNGRYIARGPARCYPHHQSTDSLELTEYIQAGTNCLAVQVYQPGYSHFAYVHRAAAGLLAYLALDGENAFVTDSRWRTKRDPSFASSVPRVSIYGSGVEERDLNLADEWTRCDYDDSGWSQARVVAPVGGYPWTNMELRALPLLSEREIAMTLLETRRGEYPSDLAADPHLALRHGWQSARQEAIATDGLGWFTPQIERGESTYWLFDLGRDHVCQGWAEINGASGQERMAVSYVEQIREGQPVLSDPQDYCRVQLTDRFILRSGGQIAESFALRGGRYLLFQLTGPSGTNCRIRFHACAAEFPLQVSRQLATSDPMLSGIIHLCEETFRACLLDGFIDGTWRENSQWVGDALPQALIMSAMSDDVRPLRRVIEMAAQGAYPDGALPSVLPSEAHAYTVVDYNFMWVELLDHYWKIVHDRGFVQEMWNTLVKIFDYFDRTLNADGLIVSEPGRRLFLDWAPVSRNEPNAIYNLHYLFALQTATQLAKAMGASDVSEIWQARADKLKAAIRTAFWYRGRWYDDLPCSTFSQLSASFAVLTGSARSDEESALLQAIATRSLDSEDSFDPEKMVLASPFMHHYIFEVLRLRGRYQETVEIIRQRWGRWVKADCPTAWENWNVEFPDGSQCHAFSTHPRYHLAEIARTQGGLDPKSVE